MAKKKKQLSNTQPKTKTQQLIRMLKIAIIICNNYLCLDLLLFIKIEQASYYVHFLEHLHICITNQEANHIVFAPHHVKIVINK